MYNGYGHVGTYGKIGVDKTTPGTFVEPGASSTGPTPMSSQAITQGGPQITASTPIVSPSSGTTAAASTSAGLSSIPWTTPVWTPAPTASSQAASAEYRPWVPSWAYQQAQLRKGGKRFTDPMMKAAMRQLKMLGKPLRRVRDLRTPPAGFHKAPVSDNMAGIQASYWLAVASRLAQYQGKPEQSRFLGRAARGFMQNVHSGRAQAAETTIPQAAQWLANAQITSGTGDRLAAGPIGFFEAIQITTAEEMKQYGEIMYGEPNVRVVITRGANTDANEIATGDRVPAILAPHKKGMSLMAKYFLGLAIVLPMLASYGGRKRK